MNLEQYKVFQFSNVCKTGHIYSGLLSELELFQFDTILVVAYRVGKILGIELSDFYLHQCQMSLISYHSININHFKTKS